LPRPGIAREQRGFDLLDNAGSTLRSVKSPESRERVFPRPLLSRVAHETSPRAALEDNSSMGEKKEPEKETAIESSSILASVAMVPARAAFFALALASSVQANPHEFTLANGLRLIVKEDRRAPTVVHQVWYRAGSMDEAPGTTGVAHVLEHMMFKGTGASARASSRGSRGGGRARERFHFH